MRPTDILTCVFALYGTEGNFNMRFGFIWDRRTFEHAFLPFMGPTEIFTFVFALYGTDGNFYMRFCLIWDRRTF